MTLIYQYSTEMNSLYIKTIQTNTNTDIQTFNLLSVRINVFRASMKNIKLMTQETILI
jgi:hypothetical protein